MEEQTEIEMLRSKNAFLMQQLAGRINCAYFCALPECAVYLEEKRKCNDCDDTEDKKAVE